MVGLGWEDAYEAIPTHAKGQCGGALWVCAGLSALLWKQWVGGADCGCLSTNIWEIFQREDGVCDGKGWDECTGQGACKYKFAATPVSSICVARLQLQSYHTFKLLFCGLSRKSANFLFFAGYGFQKGGKDGYGRDGYLACLCKPICLYSLLCTLSLAVMRTATQNVAPWPLIHQAIESAATAQTTARDPSEAKDLRKPVRIPPPCLSLTHFHSRHLNDLSQTIFSDAILAMLNAPTLLVNGLLDLDEDFLRQHLGVSDFSKYSLVEGSTPRRIMPKHFPNLRVDEHDDEGKRVDSIKLRKGKLWTPGPQ